MTFKFCCKEKCLVLILQSSKISSPHFKCGLDILDAYKEARDAYHRAGDLNSPKVVLLCRKRFFLQNIYLAFGFYSDHTFNDITIAWFYIALHLSNIYI